MEASWAAPRHAEKHPCGFCYRGITTSALSRPQGVDSTSAAPRAAVDPAAAPLLHLLSGCSRAAIRRLWLWTGSCRGGFHSGSSGGAACVSLTPSEPERHSSASNTICSIRRLGSELRSVELHPVAELNLNQTSVFYIVGYVSNIRAQLLIERGAHWSRSFEQSHTYLNILWKLLLVHAHCLLQITF